MENFNIREELKYCNEKYNFENALSIPLILNQICQFLNKDNRTLLSLCNKNIYLYYCKQIKKLKINKEAQKSNIQILIYKYVNINNLDLSQCENIKDFTPISKLENLEILNISKTNISDISFIENNKNINELYLRFCEKIKDFTPISKLQNLEIVDIGYTYISDISFLENNKNIKKLNLINCKHINDFTPISKLERLEFINISKTYISYISFLENNKNIKELYLPYCA